MSIVKFKKLHLAASIALALTAAAAQAAPVTGTIGFGGPAVLSVRRTGTSRLALISPVRGQPPSGGLGLLRQFRCLRIRSRSPISIGELVRAQ